MTTKNFQCFTRRMLLKIFHFSTWHTRNFLSKTTILPNAKLILLIATYADAVHSKGPKGAVVDNCFGFIDGTVRPISRPMSNQRVVYNGHKRVHALKFQDVSLPNGLIANIYGPVGKPQIFFLFTKQSFSPFIGMFMEFFFHFTCLLLLPYFLVKFFYN